ncbi:MAG: HlyD family type I secretion periplasmic adaptor subunit [Lentisphaerae bacterium]|nr:HlyD family type I secretion periplasmic adaptor subunit [Lentisphaerota bacterium]
MSRKEKLNNVAVDFQPDAVEIAMRPVPFAAKLGVWIGVVFFFGSLIASYFCRVDVIVDCKGKLVSVNQNIVMKPLDRTVIKSIDVHVGDVVKEGQLLMTFDPTINKAEEERLTSEYKSIKAQYERWHAEYIGKEYDPGIRWICTQCSFDISGTAAPDICPACRKSEDFRMESSKDERHQRDIFLKRQLYYQEKIRYFDESIRQIETNIAATRDQLAKQRERLGNMKELVEMQEKLAKNKAGTKVELLQYRLSYQQQEAEISKLENSLREGSHQIESNKAQKQTFVNEWKKDVVENLVAAEQSQTTIKKSLDKVLQLNQYILLRAPCDAIVHEIANFPVGSAVREAEALITLVPINCEIEVEAEIPSQDIGKVKSDFPVRIKLNAFPFQKHGTLSGKIRTISEDTFQKQANEMEMDSARTYYRSRVKLDPESKLRNVHGNFRLIPGMEVQAEIKVGTRSVLEYVVHPLIKSLDEAIREP